MVCDPSVVLAGELMTMPTFSSNVVLSERTGLKLAFWSDTLTVSYAAVSSETIGLFAVTLFTSNGSPVVMVSTELTLNVGGVVMNEVFSSIASILTMALAVPLT
jgi:hypothetical protein